MKNAVILNKDASTWPRIKKYWEERGVDTSALVGDEIGRYYGVINGLFWLYALVQVEAAKAEIIELPEEPVTYNLGSTEYTTWKPEPIPKEEKKYPRVMWVWMDGFENSPLKKEILFEREGLYFEGVGNTLYKAWDYVKEIDSEIEVTLEEIAAWKGVSVEQVKIKK